MFSLKILILLRRDERLIHLSCLLFRALEIWTALTFSSSPFSMVGSNHIRGIAEHSVNSIPLESWICDFDKLVTLMSNEIPGAVSTIPSVTNAECLPAEFGWVSTSWAPLLTSWLIQTLRLLAIVQLIKRSYMMPRLGLAVHHCRRQLPGFSRISLQFQMDMNLRGCVLMLLVKSSWCTDW